MGMHLVVQPLAGYGAEVVSPTPGVRQLVAGAEGTTVLVQVPARIGGLMDTARFAHSLAAAASEFGEWCEMQHRTRTHPSLLGNELDEEALDPFAHKEDSE